MKQGNYKAYLLFNYIRYFQSKGIDPEFLFKGTDIVYQNLKEIDWLDFETHITKVWENLDKEFSGPEVNFHIGYDVYKNKSMGMLDTIARLASLKYIIRQFPTFAKRYSDVEQFETHNLTDTGAVVLYWPLPEFQKYYSLRSQIFLEGLFRTGPKVYEVHRKLDEDAIPDANVEVELSYVELQSVFTIDYKHLFPNIHWEYANDQFFVEGKPVARKFILGVEDCNFRRREHFFSDKKSTKIYCSKEGECVVNLSNQLNREGIGYRVIDDFIIEGKRILKKGQIFNAPYTRFNLTWQKIPFKKRVHFFLAEKPEYLKRSREQLLAQLELADKRYKAEMAAREFAEEKEKETRFIKEELEKSEARYRLLADNVSDNIWVFDLQTLRFSYVSPSVTGITGFTSEEATGFNLEDTLTPSSLAIANNALEEELIAAGQHYDPSRSRVLELEQYRKNGSTVWTEVVVRFIYDQQQPVAILGVTRDISQRRQIMDRLLENEEKFRALAERCPFAIMIYQNDYWVYVNPAAEAISGYTAEEFYRKRFWEVVHPDYRQQVLENGKKRQSGMPAQSSYDLKIMHKTGREVWVSLSGSSLMYEGKPAGLVTIMDITERQKAEAGLHKSEEKYRTILENMEDGYFEVDIAGNFTFYNNAMCKILGYQDNELMGMNNRAYMDAENANNVYHTFNYVYQTGESYKALDWELIRKDGTTCSVETSVSLLKDDKGRAIGFKGIARDITERKRLQNQLQKSQKMESLGLLAGGVAHDLNNVLSGIVSYPELLLMGLPEGSKLKKPLKTIMESGNRAAAIVQDLLTIARGVAIIKEPLKLNELVSDYLSSPEFKKLKQFYPGVMFRAYLAENLLNIDASDVHIRKILMNLISNAAEAVKESGNVSVSTDNRFLDKPLEGYEQIDIGEYAVLSVADDGMGISTNDLKRIFEPFYTKKKMGRSGTGLGLSVVWNIMRDHKGYINVKSDGVGTVFELYFPITREVVFKRDTNISSISYKGNGERILVVDDIESQREITSSMLDMLGYQNESVSSGEEAIEYLKQSTVDLILLDMIMDQGINGYETYKQIIKNHPGQKAIILSGFSETGDVKKTKSLGAGKYLKKPVTLEKLGIAIKEELKKSL